MPSSCLGVALSSAAARSAYSSGLRSAGAAFSAGAWEVRRFRPNFLIDLDGQGWLEDAWADRCLRVREAQLLLFACRTKVPLYDKLAH